MGRVEWTDRDTLLSRAVRILAQHGQFLVITSRVGGGEDFELDGKPVREVDVLIRASVLDMTLLVTRCSETPLDRRRIAV